MNNTAALNTSNDNGSRVFTGTKYNRDLDVAEIAKLLRADLKAAKLGVKFGVRVRRFAGGCAIDVTIKTLPVFRVVNPERVIAEIETPHAYPLPDYLTTEGRELLNKVEGMLQAYNRDASDTMFDYFCVNFYGHADYASELIRAEREEIRQEYLANQ